MAYTIDNLNPRYQSLDGTILGEGVVIPCDGRKTLLNNNTLAIGPPGSGKTWGYVISNIMQLNSSYVISDPKGNLYDRYAPGLRDAGYDVKLLDFVRTWRSNTRWNAFANAREEKDRLSLCEALCAADGVSRVDPFWFQSASMAAEALSYLAEELKARYGLRPVATFRDIHSLAQLLYKKPNTLDYRHSYDAFGYTAVDELFDDIRFGTEHGRWSLCEESSGSTRQRVVHDDANSSSDDTDSELIKRFEELFGTNLDNTNDDCRSDENYNTVGKSNEKVSDDSDSTEETSRTPFEPKPSCAAVITWDRVRNVAERTFMSILVSLHAALNKTHVKEFLDITDDTDIPTIDFESLGRKPTALFIVTSDVDRMLDPFLGVLYSQVVMSLVRVADSECSDNDNRLKVPVRVIMDDFGCIGKVPGITDWVGSMRSRDIWLTIVIQGISQLREKYGRDGAQTIMTCCDQLVYVGLNDLESMEDLSHRNDIPLERIQETGVGKEWVSLRGRKARRCNVYNPVQHPNYQEFAVARFREELESSLTML